MICFLLEKKRIKFGAVILLIILFFSFLIIPARADTYIHGYFRYTVEDNSVTIIAYNGSEEEVTVPWMIAGNPVNVIGPGVFSTNPYVKVIYLPDTIMEIDETAFSSSQTIIYYSQQPAQNNDSDSAQSNSTEESAEIQESKNDTSEPWSDLGMIDSAGNLITVDSDNNLILVDKDGVEFVLDDTQEYIREYKEDGDILIVTEKEEQIILKDGEEITFTDGNEDTVTINTSSGIKTIETENEVITYQVVFPTVSDEIFEEESSEVSEKIESGSSEETAVPTVVEAESAVSDSIIETVESGESSVVISTEKTDGAKQTVKVLLVIGVVLLAGVVAVVRYLEKKKK